MKNRTLALAGLFQSTELVRQAANHGTWSGFGADACLNALLAIEADSTEAVYGGAQNLRLGIETLIAVLGGDRRYIESLGYAISIMQLETRFRKDRTMQETVGARLQAITRLGDDLEDYEKRDLQAQEVAKLYCKTISTINPRIVVHGKPQYLQVPRTVNWIRALLFAGLRSAVLWRQLGGGRFSLMFGRKKMLRQAESLLPG
ncbi:MAG: high frequency lysogenization protein HflD [Lysobacterales bacterium]|jgi:high frequency lysogenization protein